jgi:hypothetical protein
MKVTGFLLLLFLAVLTAARAAPPVIIDSEGYACMGDDKSRKETELSAFYDSKHKAAQSAATHVQSETQVRDGVLEKDLVAAYANAQVKVLQELTKGWYKEAELGDCYRVKLRVEVSPDANPMTALTKKEKEVPTSDPSALLARREKEVPPSDPSESDPSAPLSVRIWTDRPFYLERESIRVFVRSNKPFYGRVVYRQADGTKIQLLPNRYRKQNYFNGGSVYEIPSGADRFNMRTCAPFGLERITLYASTAPMAGTGTAAAGSSYRLRSGNAVVPVRASRLTGASDSGQAEFAEAVTELTTRRR